VMRAIVYTVIVSTRIGALTTRTVSITLYLSNHPLYNPYLYPSPHSLYHHCHPTTLHNPDNYHQRYNKRYPHHPNTLTLLGVGLTVAVRVVAGGW